MALADFIGPNYILDWSMDLDRRWPERIAISQCVVRAILSWCRNAKRNDIRIVELGVGAGMLAASVLYALDKAPIKAASYIGFDINPALTRHSLERLRGVGQISIRVETTDLNDATWRAALAPVDVAFTLQTLHGLGGYVALTAAYRNLFALLAPGGLLINADFVVPFAADDVAKPRRFSIEAHLQLMQSIGFVQGRCLMSRGKQACLSAVRPQAEPGRAPPGQAPVS